jgi:hypothetical protein
MKNHQHATRLFIKATHADHRSRAVAGGFPAPHEKVLGGTVSPVDRAAASKRGSSRNFLPHPAKSSTPVPRQDETLPRGRIRKLKIEGEGDSWKSAVRPKIRLLGRWLEKAGFRPGSHVHILCLAPGVIELRSSDLPIPDDVAPAEKPVLPRNSLALVRQETGAAKSTQLFASLAGQNPLHQRTPDQFAYCGQHFYNSSPRTRALGTYWRNCAYCGKTLQFHNSHEQALACRTECNNSPTPLTLASSE